MDNKPKNFSMANPNPDQETHQTSYTSHHLKTPPGLSTEEFEELKQPILDFHTYQLQSNQCSSLLAQRINVPKDVVWSIVRRFDYPQTYKQFIKTCSVPDNFKLIVGSTRDVEVTSGPWATSSTDRLDILDDDHQVTGFSIIGGNNRLRNYRSVTTVHGFNRQGTVVLESYMVDVPEGNTEEDTSFFADSVVKLNLRNLASVSEMLFKTKEKDALAEVDEEDFTAVFEEDSEHNVELWRALAGPHASLPKKGDAVVYFPQGHLEYAALLPSLKPFYSKEAPAFGLQPQVICRVVHVQLIANKKNDEVCADVTLLPDMMGEGCLEKNEVEWASEVKEVEWARMEGTKHGISLPKQASRLFSKTLEVSDTETLVVPMEDENILLFQDYVQLGSSQEVAAWDFHGTEWLLELNSEDKQRNYSITRGWSEFVREKHLVPGDTVVFVRGEDRELRLGIRRAGCHEIGVPESIIAKNYGSSNFLSPVADAILNDSMFHVFYCPRANFADFLIPYAKYMRSIRAPRIGAHFQMQYKMDDSLQSGVVIGMSDYDPNKWPHSKWKCLMVSWDKDIDKNYKPRVSPWEIVCDVRASSSFFSHRMRQKSSTLSPTIKFPPQLKRPRIKFKRVKCTTIHCSPTEFRDAVISLTSASRTKNPVPNIYPQEKSKHFLLSENQSMSRCAIMETLERPKYCKPLKISNCADQQIPLDPMVHNSLEYLEFDSCLFHSPTLQGYFPPTLKELKITNCVNPEYLLTVLMDQKGLESLDIDGCSTLLSLPLDKLPTTLRHLKLVNCSNLMSLSESEDIVGDSNLANIKLMSTLELRQLVICDCPELEFLPEGLHNLNHLELLLLSNCSSLISFPEGGLPNNSLIALLIYECESLKFLPNHLHKVTSLRFLNISDCPSLMSFPTGGLPPSLISLCIIDCENLVHLSHQGLHKLKDLKSYTIVGGRLHLGEQ